ncbi:Ribosomal protein L18, bacterial-type [Moorella glycerini]|uniref:Large ribosomal subunit protein uL18 n=2 Tax=Neomoorella TaxID=44260 RepID=A0A9X7J0L9_9FIRM|nr:MULTISPECIES: 50S ribosomal protein L18 [Moorella]KYH33676.1 50S ribosomal protein L18 [Moorella mulderi DSM 14980]PRR70622.1 50S ribosomal protein L18 [Moorella stamsii]CEP68029.1 Ribosomal protein L18, bacterial-type [Moorella glycerini]
MFKRKDRKLTRQRKHLRVRRHIMGTPERPRLSVYRSLRHIYAQVVDDTRGVTLVAASTLDPALKDLEATGNIAAARKVGELVAQKALAKGIKKVVFDRGGNIYHGRIAAVAEGAREAGLDF